MQHTKRRKISSNFSGVMDSKNTVETKVVIPLVLRLNSIEKPKEVVIKTRTLHCRKPRIGKPVKFEY